jgi:hypothetical protein
MDIRKKYAKLKLLWMRKNDLASYEIIETFLTIRITEGELWRREELSKIQQRIEENKKFIKFLQGK